jgi:hypothetical protein
MYKIEAEEPRFWIWYAMKITKIQMDIKMAGIKANIA